MEHAGEINTDLAKIMDGLKEEKNNNSGLRIGELLALTWADIDFTKGTLTVNKPCHDGRDENGNLSRITDLPKTTSSKRMIPLPKQLLPVLKEYKRKSISEYVVE